MGLARRMIPILNDVDRALSQVEDDDESPVAQGLRLLRNKLWRELEADGIKSIEAKGQEFNPATMEAITTLPASEQFPQAKSLTFSNLDTCTKSGSKGCSSCRCNRVINQHADLY